MKIVFLIILFTTSLNAFALKCAVAGINDVLESSSDIFIGEISEVVSDKKIVTRSPWDAEVEVVGKLKVLEIIRGTDRQYQDVIFSYKIKPGEKYLIFNSSAFSSMCTISHSTALENAAPYLKYLNVESKVYNQQLKEKDAASGAL